MIGNFSVITRLFCDNNVQITPGVGGHKIRPIRVRWLDLSIHAEDNSK